MPQNPNIQLNYQCNEPFWKFKKDNDVDFCKTCNKHVVDYTQLSTQELIKVIKEKNGRTCGKFYEDQLIIDDKTAKGPSLSKIILASVITTLTAITSTAQTSTKDSIKTEQIPVGYNTNDKEFVDTENRPKVECLQIPEKYTKTATPEFKRVKRYYIGNSSIYVSKRFPFVHKRRRVMGRFKY